MLAEIQRTARKLAAIMDDKTIKVVICIYLYRVCFLTTSAQVYVLRNIQINVHMYLYTVVELWLVKGFGMYLV